MAMKLENSFALLASLKGEEDDISASSSVVKEKLNRANLKAAAPPPVPEQNRTRKKNRQSRKHKKIGTSEGKRGDTIIIMSKSKPNKWWPVLITCFILSSLAMIFCVGYFMLPHANLL